MLQEYKDIMTVLDVAEALSVGKNRIYELLESGELKAFRLGKVWKIPKVAVQEYILTQSHLNSTQNLSGFIEI